MGKGSHNIKIVFIFPATGSEADFTNRTVNLTFSGTVTVHQVNITITNDSYLEYDERLQAEASLATSADGVTLEPERANITIFNDDRKHQENLLAE